MWAVEQMKQGRKVRRKTRRGVFYVRNMLTWDNLDGTGSDITFMDIEATDWEICEEPKKTLSDKSYKLADKGVIFGLEEEGNLFFRNDVEDALKEVIDSLNEGHNDRDDIIDKIKQIMGEELLGDKNDC